MSFIVAIDGPAGAGKSTVARLSAEALGFALVDTGALYRCVAYRARQRGVDWADGDALGALASSLKVEFALDGEVNRVALDGEDVTEAIRSADISRGASLVSSRAPVRDALLGLQRRLGQELARGAVLEGRDIGTVVFPDAPVKIFLTASEESRARRRYEELRNKGVATTLDAVLRDQRARDLEDETRAIAPLRPAGDALRLDTTGLSVDEVVRRIVEYVRDIQMRST